MPPAGSTQPYRPMPPDFRDRWPQVGWEGAREEWGAHSRSIARWIDEAGRTDMIAARKAYVAAEREVRARSRRKRYVLGQTLTPRGRDGGEAESDES